MDSYIQRLLAKPTSYYMTGNQPSDLLMAVLRNGSLQRTKGAYYAFKQNPITAAITGAAWAHANNGVNVLAFPGFTLEGTNLGGDASAATPPVQTAVGLDIGASTQTNSRGTSFDPGILANDNQCFKVGTDGAFFFRIKAKIQTVTHANFCMGFRAAAARNADPEGYDPCAILQITGTNASPRAIRSRTRTGATAVNTTLTGNTWASGATKELAVIVDSGGRVSYEIDGVAPSAAVGYTFAADTLAIPFVQLIQGATASGTVELIEWDCGLVV